jgi:hypothetical protein
MRRTAFSGLLLLTFFITLRSKRGRFKDPAALACTFCASLRPGINQPRASRVLSVPSSSPRPPSHQRATIGCTGLSGMASASRSLRTAAMCGSTLRAAPITAVSCPVCARPSPNCRRTRQFLTASCRPRGCRKLLAPHDPDAHALARGRGCLCSWPSICCTRTGLICVACH